MGTLLSPLRYPGSKKRLVVYLQEIVEKNNLKSEVLIEPFLGGGSVALHFIANDLVKRAIVADKDQLIYSFWYVLFNRPGILTKFIKNTKIDINTYSKYKKIAKNPDGANIETLAKACIFLNRTSFSGILRNEAGPIGGWNQNSMYDLNCRFNRDLLIEKIEMLNKYRDRIMVLPYDWRTTIKYVINDKKLRPQMTLFYFDPPFYKKAKKLYRHYFLPTDHKELCDTLLKLHYPWILSYDKAREIIDLYSRFKKVHIRFPYSINSRSVRLEEEIVITPLKLPIIRRDN